MRNKIIFILVGLGALVAFLSAFLSAQPQHPVPPLFSPAPNPYPAGIYANGIVESYQSHGQNLNLYPEVSGTVSQVLVSEGQPVARGKPLFRIDDSVQRSVVEQQQAQAEAALNLLRQMQAQPRPETLEIARAQVEVAAANRRTAFAQMQKQRRSYELAPQSVSRDALDNAINAERVASANLQLARRQLALTAAGTWSYDLQTQQKQYEALSKAAAASDALLAKYTVRAPTDGVVLSINASVGSYVSPQGVYDTYTQGMGPVMSMAATEKYLAVRCYIDEILIPRLPPPEQMHATMVVRGTNVSVPLEFVRVQPYVQPKIQLSDQRTEKVDVRVLPIVFRFQPTAAMHVFPGGLVDVYIQSR